MKKALFILSIFSMGFLFSCDGENKSQTSEDEEYKIQGEETGGMGTGPGPGVDASIDSTEIGSDSITIQEAPKN